MPLSVAALIAGLVSILLVNVSDVFLPTNVSVETGSVNSISAAIAAGPISFALFVVEGSPSALPEFSKNSINPADVLPFFTARLALNISKALCVPTPENI